MLHTAFPLTKTEGLCVLLDGLLGATSGVPFPFPEEDEEKKEEKKM